MTSPVPALGPRPSQLIGGWEVGLLTMMALLYLVGAFINPKFFVSPDAFQALLRDAARYAVMAVGMTFVIADKDLDLSVGSTFGLVGVAFALIFDPNHYDLGVIPAILFCLALGTVIGLINGTLVTVLRVPSFIATLTMLFIGRGFVLGLTSGQSILFPLKAAEYRWFFHLGEFNAMGFNNQIPIALAVVAIGAVVLAKTRWGYETLATGGNEQAAIYAGIPTQWVRVRAYLLSSLCATVAALMAAAQDKGISPQSGLNAELIVIAAVIIGGASILGGRGRVIGSFIGALLTVLINKVLREGLPITRTEMINGVPVKVQAIYSLPAGAVPAFIGVLLIVAVLIEPFIIRRRVPARVWAWLRRLPPPPALETGGVAIEASQTKGAMATDKALAARGFGKFLARRDALAIMLTVLLWLIGLYLRPDYWALLPNSFAILLNYTEVALIAVGLTYVLAAGDIDLSVGAVLALAGGAAAYSLKVLGVDPGIAMLIGLGVGLFAGVVNGVLTVGLGLPAFIATLGMFYIARGAASWIVAGQQLTGFREQYNLIGRKISDILHYYRHPQARRAAWRASRRCQRPDLVDAARRRHRRHRAGLYALRPEALRHRRQPPCRSLRRHRHGARPFHRDALLRALRDDGRTDQRCLFPQLQPRRRPVPRARRHRRGHHRRRIDLRRLWHDDRCAGRGGGDYAGAGAAPAQRARLHHAAASG